MQSEISHCIRCMTAISSHEAYVLVAAGEKRAVESWRRRFRIRTTAIRLHSGPSGTVYVVTVWWCAECRPADATSLNSTSDAARRDDMVGVLAMVCAPRTYDEWSFILGDTAPDHLVPAAFRRFSDTPVVA